LFWFNPLVWVLAREAHQLREETADDAVLAADISDTDYAQLLVGVARHECPGLLLGAHGVAPSKSSLARRVARVLDGQSVRGPAARSFAAGVFVGAVLVAAPLAALTLAPAGTKEKQKAAAVVSTKTAPQTSYYAAAGDPEVPTDLGSIIADGVSTSVQAAVGAAVPARIEAAQDVRSAAIEQALDSAAEARRDALKQARVAIADAGRDIRAVHGPGSRSIVIGDGQLTPEYIGAMRAISPRLARLGIDEFAGMRAVGVTPDYARGMIAAFPSIDSDGLVEARAIGLTGPYVQALRGAGVRGDLDDFVQMRTIGIDPSFVARARKAGVNVSDPDELVELHVLNGSPVPPRPPAAPRAPAPPGGWDDDPNDG
jgi:hypothetical protein